MSCSSCGKTSKKLIKNLYEKIKEKQETETYITKRNPVKKKTP